MDTDSGEPIYSFVFGEYKYELGLSLMLESCRIECHSNGCPFSHLNINRFTHRQCQSTATESVVHNGMSKPNLTNYTSIFHRHKIKRYIIFKIQPESKFPTTHELWRQHEEHVQCHWCAPVSRIHVWAKPCKKHYHKKCALHS